MGPIHTSAYSEMSTLNVTPGRAHTSEDNFLWREFWGYPSGSSILRACKSKNLWIAFNFKLNKNET